MKATLTAAILSLVTLTSANAAAPQALSSQTAPVLARDSFSGILTQVQHHGHSDKKRAHKHRRYKPGSRHHKAPKHWRRYKHRPHDWYRRGCIIVGPVWFCP